MRNCFFCKTKKAGYVCSRCKTEYCGSTCHQKDWPRHQAFCFTGATILGEGTFNVVILPDDQMSVVRVSKYDEADVKRGAHITHLFQQFSKLLGPSLVKELAPLKIIKNIGELDAKVRTIVRQKLLSPPLYVQGLEYLTGGLRPDPNTSPEAVAFPLVWFFSMARKYFQFKHADFTVNNVVMRNYEQEQTFTFELDKTHRFMIKTRQIPVVIDFDFSSVLVTDIKQQQDVGTALFQPPEALEAKVLEVWYEDPKFTEKLNQVTDFWSLGIVLFFWWVKELDNINSIDKQSIQKYREAVKSNYKTSHNEKEETPNYWETTGFIGLWNAYRVVTFLGHTVPTNSLFYSGQARKILEQAPPIQSTRPLLTNFQLNLLRRLLSWEPEERNQGLFTEHFQTAKFNEDAQYIDDPDVVSRAHNSMSANYDDLKYKIHF